MRARLEKNITPHFSAISFSCNEFEDPLSLRVCPPHLFIMPFSIEFCVGYARTPVVIFLREKRGTQRAKYDRAVVLREFEHPRSPR